MSRQRLDTVLQRVRSVAGRRPPAAQTDSELLDRFATAREETAFAALVARHYPMVLGVCRRVVNHAQDAEDACQATFLALARQAATVRRREALAGWLYRVARRIALKARTSADRRAVRTDEAATVPAAMAATPDVTWREALAVLDEELVRMPAAYRSALVLCYLEGKTQDEAARQLGRTLGTLRGQLERGRERLRARLVRRGVSLAALVGVALNQHVTAGPTAAAVGRAALQYAGEPSAVPARVAALVGQGAKIMITAKTKLGAVLILAAGILAVTLHVTAQPERPGGPEKEPGGRAPAADRSGDPLPAGALFRLGTTRLRHAGLYSLAFAADGSLASFGADHTVRVWKPATGQLLRQLPVENDKMHRFWGGCLSPDGKRVAVQVFDQMKVFDTASGKELASVRLLSSYEGRARFSPDGQSLAVVHHDGRAKHQLHLCDVETNTTREFGKIHGFFSEPAFSRNGRRLAVAEGNPHGIGVWDVAAGKELLRFSPPGLLGGYVEFDPTGDVLAVLGAINPPQQIHYVQVSTGKAPEGWTVPPVSDFEWVRFSPDGSAILFGGRKGIQWCDPKTGKVTFAADGWAATPPAFSVDGRFVAEGGENSIQLWDVSSGKPTPVHKQDTDGDEVHGLAVSPDGKWFVTKQGGTGALQVWDEAGQRKGSINSNRWGGRYPLFDADGRHLFGVAADAIALVRWEFPGGKEVARYTFDEPAKDHVYVYHFGLSADGKRLAAFTQTSNRGGGGGGPGGAGGPGGRGGEVATLTVWDVATGKRLAGRPFDSTYTTTSPLFGYGAFTPDLQWYFGGEKAIALAGDADHRLELPAGWSFPRQAAVSPDGRLVAQVIGEPKGKDRQVEWRRIFVHEVATGKLVAIVPAGFCGPIAFTPDSRGLITTNPDAITRWDLATLQPVVQHKSPAPFTGSYGNSFASSLIVTPDGTRAITGQRDTTALIWDMKAPAREARNLTEREIAAAWDDLGGHDAAKAYLAVWALADAPGAAVPFLRGRLRPATGPSDKQAAELIAKLDAPAFATREAAEKELRGFGDTALPALRAALEGKPSSEQRERLEHLVTVATNAVPTAELLQRLRAVAALERAGTAEAKAILKELAGGTATGRLTVEASAALKRSR